MFLLYLDEFGHDGIWDPQDPAHSHHPLFGLAGFFINANNFKDLDRGYLRLKSQYYAREIGRCAPRLRAERYEPKQLQNRRDRRFAAAVLALVARLNGHVIAQGQLKTAGGSLDSNLYTHTMHRVMQAFERALRFKYSKSEGRGIIVMDQRQEARDVELLAWAQSHLFSTNAQVGQFERLIETPLLVRSEWYHGVQAADTICRVVGAVHRFRCTREPQYEQRAMDLGPALDALAVTRSPRWSSVHIKRPFVQRPQAPSRR